jgi:hypothetical protein
MYATCLFCGSGLGSNAAIEHFPVGRRLAFDTVKGRLWVVCGKCNRWNLSPLEERWEAIEECERLYRETFVRVSTENVGLAQVREGTELVRIGAPVRPEFAAWRYGGVLQKRWQSVAFAGTVGGAVALVAAPFVLPTALPVIVGFALTTMISPVLKAGVIGTYMAGKKYITADRVVAHLPVDGDILKIRVRQLNATYLDSGAGDDDLVLNVPHDRGTATLVGNEALSGAARLLARANRIGAPADFVRKAVDTIERAGSPESFLAAAAVRSHPKHRRYLSYQSALGALRLAPIERLALEMAVHEAAERRALEGELAELEVAWRRAEEIAAISDSLLLPDEVSDAIPRRDA